MGINTIKRSGSRFYVHPATAIKAPGVTSVVGMIPKEFLRYWAAKVVAEEAVDNAGALAQLALNGTREGAIDWLKRSPDRFTKKAADVGSDVHDLFERQILGHDVGRVHPDLKPYVDHFDAFLQEYAPRVLMAEQTVWSDSHAEGAYAGSFDAFLEIEDKDEPGHFEIVVTDWKTTRSGVHSEVALQLSAYAHADYVLGEDGEHIDLPKAEGGAVLHVRPEGWGLHPIKCDESVFEFFLSLRRVFDWVKEEEKHVVGKPINADRVKSLVGASVRRGRK